MPVSFHSSSPLPGPIPGLSSPFRDGFARFLSTPSHVIDISPSPPPPALGSLNGKFEDVISPISNDQVKSLEKIETSKLQLKPISTYGPTHQTIGLGLGIHTDEGTLQSYMDVAQATAIPSNESKGSIFKTNQLSQFTVKDFSTRRARPNKPWSRRGISFRPGAFDDRGYLAEDEEEEETHHRQTKSNQDRGKATDVLRDFSLADHGKEIFHKASHKGVADVFSYPSEVKSGMVLPLPFLKGPRRVQGKKLTKGLAKLGQKNPRDEDLPPRTGSFLPSVKEKMYKAIVLKKRQNSSENLMSGFLRNTLAERDVNGTDNSPSHSFTNPSGEYNGMPNVITFSPATTTSVSVQSSTTSMASAATPLPILSNVDSPLLLPLSPAIPLHSPGFSEAPGSFSPLVHDASSFPPSSLNTPQPNEVPMDHGTTSFVFSLLAGSLGIFGIFFIILALSWKKNSTWSGFSFWKRKPRGTAYDEFMEDEKGWWLGEDTKDRRPKNLDSSGAVTGMLKNNENDLIDTQGTMVKFSRSESQAPSIPPIAHMANGKLSIDTIRIDISPRSSLSGSMRSLSSDGIAEELIKQNSDQISWDIHNILAVKPAMPTVDLDRVHRSRSGSKSSNLSKASKASKKSMSSIASFIVNRKTLEAFGAVKKKPFVDLGISSEDYKQYLLASAQFEVPEQPPHKVSEQTSHKVFDTTKNSLPPEDSGEIEPGPVSTPVKEATPLSRSFEPARRPNIVTFTPPAILITDHPSELIPPSPPRHHVSVYRPESIGTILTSYSAASYDSEDTPINDRYSCGSQFSSRPPSGAVQRDGGQDSSISHGTISCQQILSIERCKVLEPDHMKFPNMRYQRGRRSDAFESSSVEVPLHSTARFGPSDRSSLNSIASSRTIIELAAVTQDLRALIDSDISEDCSWHSPSLFHVSVPDRPPSRFSALPGLPPTRPPKSANRYRPIQRLSIEYESASTPSSPINLRPLQLAQNSIFAEWGSDVIHPPSKAYNQSQSSSACNKASNLRRQKSDSDASLETAISAESNTSIFEVASLHTAQTVRGASAEFVIRPPLSSSYPGNEIMMAIIEEIDNEIQD